MSGHQIAFIFYSPTNMLSDEVLYLCCVKQNIISLQYCWSSFPAMILDERFRYSVLDLRALDTCIPLINLLTESFLVIFGTRRIFQYIFGSRRTNIARTEMANRLKNNAKNYSRKQLFRTLNFLSCIRNFVGNTPFSRKKIVD